MTDLEFNDAEIDAALVAADPARQVHGDGGNAELWHPYFQTNPPGQT